ncbi:Os04g0587150 [Oryza sativa Japonica Group]|uniref:Os04g0587150 protein n=1 Tax=Oryza sativa subsp. japonica TaxID=39947 RepID=A0A0P0WE86_ORYSJ|nr:Os04g0587150 [Oryza sativa Japonica Group]
MSAWLAANDVQASSTREALDVVEEVSRRSKEKTMRGENDRTSFMVVMAFLVLVPLGYLFDITPFIHSFKRISWMTPAETLAGVSQSLHACRESRDPGTRIALLQKLGSATC